MYALFLLNYLKLEILSLLFLTNEKEIMIFFSIEWNLHLNRMFENYLLHIIGYGKG